MIPWASSNAAHNGIIASMHTADAAAVQRRHGMQGVRKKHNIFPAYSGLIRCLAPNGRAS